MFTLLAERLATEALCKNNVCPLCVYTGTPKERLKLYNTALLLLQLGETEGTVANTLFDIVTGGIRLVA